LPRSDGSRHGSARAEGRSAPARTRERRRRDDRAGAFEGGPARHSLRAHDRKRRMTERARWTVRGRRPRPRRLAAGAVAAAAALVIATVAGADASITVASGVMTISVNQVSGADGDNTFVIKPEGGDNGGIEVDNAFVTHVSASCLLHGVVICD